MKRSPFCIALLLGLVSAVAGADTITLNGIIRDFSSSHPDFEGAVSGVVTGIVESTLGLDGKPVYNAACAGCGATSNAANFDQWYNNVAGVNLAMVYPITLDNGMPGPGGVYTFIDGSFFPIDGVLFGNEGRSHNYHFTYQIHTSFTYQPGQSFTFTGDDDLWVFINHQLAVDIGGVHGQSSKSVNLDTLGLTPGNDYDFDLFFAERHTVASSFRIDTSIQLKPNPVPEPGTGSLLALGLAGLVIRAKRRRA